MLCCLCQWTHEALDFSTPCTRLRTYARTYIHNTFLQWYWNFRSVWCTHLRLNRKISSTRNEIRVSCLNQEFSFEIHELNQNHKLYLHCNERTKIHLFVEEDFDGEPTYRCVLTINNLQLKMCFYEFAKIKENEKFLRGSSEQCVIDISMYEWLPNSRWPMPMVKYLVHQAGKSAFQW